MSEIDIQGIIECLPHRYPFILIDKVLSYEPYKNLVAIKNVTVNEPFFMGHFPERPIMPGVLMLESLAQACAILANRSIIPPEGMQLFHFFAGIDKARFKHVVTPGDQLRIEVEMMNKKQDIWRMGGKITVDGKLACSAVLMSASKEEKSDQ